MRISDWSSDVCSSDLPVEIVAERRDAVAPRQLRLRVTRLGDAKVVEAEIGRQPRLLVTVEQRAGTGDVGPFGEALAPPGVVLRHRMVLRQVEGDRKSTRLNSSH